MRLNIVGAGDVGRTLARLFRENGLCEIGGIVNSSIHSAEQAAEFIGGGWPVANIRALTPADIIMISVSDAAINAVAVSLADEDIVQEGAIAFHCSGGVPSSALGPLAKKGVKTCAVHPVKSFSDPETCLRTFPGTFCGAEGDDHARDLVGRLFEGCGARIFTLKTEEKEIYHAGGVFVCNYLTALLDFGLKCYEHAGLERGTALEVMGPLVLETVRNVLEFGPEPALTGPVARGDHELVRNHILKLTEWDAGVAALYRELGKAAVDIARRKGAADPRRLAITETLLR
jgi:predicted short-subunit dehydrogenase-like oxidoreductase (DUF2520 family)